MSLKIKQDGKVKDLIIPACGVQILDMEDNFKSDNLEEVLQEIGEGESVYISDKEPDKDGLWVDTTDIVADGNGANENPVAEQIKKYMNDKIGDLSMLNTNVKDNLVHAVNAINKNTSQMSNITQEIENVKTNYAKKTDVNALASNKAEKVDLQDTNTELATQKARMEQIDNNKINKYGSGEVTWANLAQDAREKISGNKVAVVETDSILEINYTDKSVTPWKTSFIEIPNEYNRITDESNTGVGYWWDSEGGITTNITQTENALLYQFIKVEPNASYVFNKIIRTARGYDKNQKLIASSVTVPNGASKTITTNNNSSLGYIRIGLHPADIQGIIMQKGTVIKTVKKPYLNGIDVLGLNETIELGKKNANHNLLNKTKVVINNNGRLNILNQDGTIKINITTGLDISYFDINNKPTSFSVTWGNFSSDLSLKKETIDNKTFVSIENGYYLWLDIINKRFGLGSAVTNINQRYIDGLVLFENNNGNLTKNSCLIDNYLNDRVNAIYSECIEPNYWRLPLNSTISKINDFQINGGHNAFTFGFITDTHWANNAKNNDILLANVLNKCKIATYIDGGDVVTGLPYVTKEEIIKDLKNQQYHFRLIEDKCLRTQGNHDTAYNDTANSVAYYYAKDLNDKEIYNYLYRANSVKNNIVYGNNKTYFYKDDNCNKVRYICLNTNDIPDSVNEQGLSIFKHLKFFAIRQEQMDWFADVALNVPNDEWSIVVSSHIPLNNVDYNSKEPVYFGDIVLGILKAFKEKTTYSKSLNYTDFGWKVSKSVNFTGKGGNVICCIAGHIHKDTITDKDGIKLVTTLNDSLSNETGEAKKTINTNTEHAIDFYVVNKETRVVNIIRLGAGSDRLFKY